MLQFYFVGSFTFRACRFPFFQRAPAAPNTCIRGSPPESSGGCLSWRCLSGRVYVYGACGERWRHHMGTLVITADCGLIRNSWVHSFTFKPSRNRYNLIFRLDPGTDKDVSRKTGKIRIRLAVSLTAGHRFVLDKHTAVM